MTDYIYTLSGDFGVTGTNFNNFVSFNQLHREIEDNSSIAPTLTSVDIDQNADSVTITFDSTLNTSEETTLDNIVSAHVPDYSPPRIQFFNVAIDTKRSKSSSWETITSFKYEGSYEIGIINYIDVVSKMQVNTTDYDIRVVDTSNANVLCMQTGLTNTLPTTVDMGTISNIPENATVLDVQVRRNGNGSQWVYIHQVIVFHGN